MACGNYAGGERSLEANSGELQYVWFTTWFLAVGIDKLRAVIKNRGVVGNFQSQLAYQVAEVRTDVPGAPTAVANTIKTGAGELNTEDVNIASATGPVFFVRVGIAYKISSGTTPSRADVSLEVSFDQCGKSVGTRSFTVSTDLGSGSKITVPITDFFPAVSADKLKCAIIVSGASSDFRCELAYRPATTSKQSPGSWNNSFTPAGPTYSGNTETLAMAFAWLRYNRDVVRWAAQRWIGASGRRDLLDLILDLSLFQIRFDPDNMDFSAYYSVVPHLTIPTHAGSVWLDEYRTKVRVRGAEVYTAENAFVVMDLAATLLHELVHVAGDYGGTRSDPDEPGECFGSYLTENDFRWGCLNFYQELRQCPCGVESGFDLGAEFADYLFSDDTSEFLVENCDAP